MIQRSREIHRTIAERKKFFLSTAIFDPLLLTIKGTLGFVAFNLEFKKMRNMVERIREIDMTIYEKYFFRPQSLLTVDPLLGSSV